jgi:hypothetical protein
MRIAPASSFQLNNNDRGSDIGGGGGGGGTSGDGGNCSGGGGGGGGGDGGGGGGVSGGAAVGRWSLPTRSASLPPEDTSYSATRAQCGVEDSVLAESAGGRSDSTTNDFASFSTTGGGGGGGSGSNGSGGGNFTLDDRCGEPVVLNSSKRDIIFATYCRFLLLRIGGSDSFYEKQAIFRERLCKQHGRVGPASSARDTRDVEVQRYAELPAFVDEVYSR